MKKKLMNRLLQLPTLHINPEKKLSFTYGNRKYQGVSGDSLATALYANGIRIFSRSLKYRRPRGLYSLDGESSNCLMEVDRISNVQAETTRLHDGMHIEPQNVTISPQWDFSGYRDKLGKFMGAGFYYRHLHKPRTLSPFVLKRIRKAAGIGAIASSFQIKGNYDEHYINTDVCVIGGGPAGISAALAAAEQGLQVALLEARPWLGGFLDYRAAEYAPNMPLYMRGWELAEKLEVFPFLSFPSSSLGTRGSVRVFTHTCMTGIYNNNHITAFQKGSESDGFDERYIEIRAKSIVIATGCIERPLLFDHNDRPGIMQAGCIHRLARTYGLLAGEQAVFSVAHNLGLEAAADLSDLGMTVLAVADARSDGQDPQLVEALTKRNIPFLRGWVASAVSGKKMVENVTLTTTDGIKQREFVCDTLAASAGLTPSPVLSLTGAKMEFDTHTGFFLPRQLPANIHAGGRLLGFHDALSVETSGQLAGLFAAKDCGASVDSLIRETQEKLKSLPGASRGSKLVQAPITGHSRRFICLDMDVTIKDIEQACEMGFDAVELAKRFTGAGTGPGQSGIPGHNLPLLISQYLDGTSVPETPSTIRPPVVPCLLATCAGKNYRMVKHSPLMKDLFSLRNSGFPCHPEAGAWEREKDLEGFENLQGLKPEASDAPFSCQEEVENVRNNVGITDASALGKFRIFGPDAKHVLQCIYVSNMSEIHPGKLKYSAMCNEDGCPIDDGIILKEDINNYFFTTSPGRADAVIGWFRYHTRYDKWDYHMVNLTDAFGAICLAGPNARKVLQKITDTDVSNAAFPYMTYQRFMLKKTIPAHVMRMGFVGELSYEIHVPASLTQAVWELLMEAGEEFSIRHFGQDALDVLCLEKGRVRIGRENAWEREKVTLHDLGIGTLWSRKKEGIGTIGAPSLSFTKHLVGRLKLVGFKTENPERLPKDGSIIVDGAIRGYVCTARYSFTLNTAIGMALVESQLAKQGNRLEIFEVRKEKPKNEDEKLYATIVPMPFVEMRSEKC